MKNLLMSNILTVIFREYIFIILTATIILLTTFSKSFSQENVFIIDQIKVQGVVDINFSREKYVDKAFRDSFKILMSKILLSKDFERLENIKLKKIKELINSLQILEESYKKNEYKATFKIYYNDFKIKKFLAKKNISFSQPKKIAVVFFPALIVNEEIQNFSENYFYQHWNKIEIKNELIDYILPLEDLDDLSKIEKMKNRIEEIKVEDFVNKYDIKNYTFALIDYNKNQLNVHIKTNFDNNRINKNYVYELNNINDKTNLDFILRDLKKQITDVWKESNIVNLLMPLSIRVKFEYADLIDLDKLKNTFYKISIIDSYDLEEFDMNHSYFKLFYYGNPKKLKTELLKFGYDLNDRQGHWELNIND